MGRRASSSSPTAAAAAVGARATARWPRPSTAELSARCCWTCSRRPRTWKTSGRGPGAAAALIAAARRQDQVGAVVSRGGRPDLAGEALEQVKAPTLLIVGGRDEAVVSLNEQAMTRMKCEKRLDVVPGATHLFSEPGALERVADLAADWFSKKLS